MSKKIIIIIVVVLILSLIAGVVVGMFLFKNKEPKEVIIPTYSLTLDDLYCNIKDSKKILKIKITIETIDEKMLEELSNKQFLIRDNVNKTITNQTEDILRGENGQTSLQNQLKTNIGNIFNTESITNIYFNDFIIQ